MFQFTALSGAQSTSRASQSILELDGGVKILVDVGWDERFDTRQLAALEKHVSTLSFVLLTHATISHLGAYAHCCKHIPLFSQVPVYATAPVIAFGRTTLQDLYSSAPAAATFIQISASPEDQTAVDDATRSNVLKEAPTFEEINTYFSAVTPLKYSQPHQPAASYFSAPLEGLTLTAYNSGHTLGGTIWHIQHGMESIVYAVDWHQGRENVISGAAWFDGIGGSEVSEALRKPTALVCSSVNGDKIAISGGKKARDEALLGHIHSCLARGGSVLIPTDSSARILELAWLLEKVWQEGSSDENLKNAKVYMATKSAHATLRHARSLLEWMDDSIVREFEGDEENTNTVVKNHKRSRSKQTNATAKPSRPFEFRHVKIVETQNRLEKVLKAEGPRVIVASDLSAEWGYSRAALEHIAPNPNNLIILTERSSIQGTKGMATASTLWQWQTERLNGVALEKSLAGDQIEQTHTGRELVFRDAKRVALDGMDLSKYHQFMATQKQIRDSLLTSDGRQLADAEEAMGEDDESSSESEDEEDEQQGKVLNVSAALTHGNRNKVALSDEDLGVSILLRKKDVFDYDVRNKKGRNAVFPYTHSRKRGDEFGDFIKPEDFLREEEKEAQEAAMDEKNNSVLGQKRKWSEDKSKHTKPNKKQKSEPAPDSAAGDDASSDDSDSDAEAEGAGTEQQAPSKVVYEEKRIDFQARLAFVDFAGLHDQRSLQMLIPLINPKKLILVGGSASETTALASDCNELLGMKVDGVESETKAEIYSPQIGDIIDASVDTNAWTVKLTRDLVKRLQWQNVRNMSIVTITGHLRAEAMPTPTEEEFGSKKMKLEDGSKKVDQESEIIRKRHVEPILDSIPATAAASLRVVTQPIHVGDLRLADLRRLMRESGHSAVFRGEGTLLIDNIVAVRKLASGRIVVEGPPVDSIIRNDSFTQVKRKIYDGLAVVAAG